jgi:tetratricopeptide (TPR) repeat protein
MRIKGFTYFIIFFIFLLSSLSSNAMAENQDVTEVKAIQLFYSGKFTEAEKAFGRLLMDNPESPLLNYYYGASRTENGNFGENELDYLNFAGKSFTPERLHYYLGIQHHARGNWKQALRHYNLFRTSIPESEQRDLELEKKIQQCFNQVNPYENQIVEMADNVLPVKIPSPDTRQAGKQEPAVVEQTAVDIFKPEEYEQQFSEILAEAGVSEEQDADDLVMLPGLPVVPPSLSLPPGDAVTFQINNSITYIHTSQFHTAEGKRLFDAGSKLQNEQEKLLADTDLLRQQYMQTHHSEEKTKLTEKILSMEMESYHLQEKINAHYTASRKVENDYWENAGSSARSIFYTEQEKILEVLQAIAIENAPKEDEAFILFEETEEEYDEILPEVVPTVSAANNVNELVYKIQIGAYSKGIPAYRQKIYNKLAVIRIIENYTDETGVVVYTTGNLRKYEDAVKMQNQVKQEGIQDAQVVPFVNGKRIPLEQAKNIEAGNDF